jgi:glycosyltransferase involved in cell wall biosynthesis
MLIEMKQLAKDLNISNEVEFLGRVNNVDFHLSEASIFILPSILEGFPNALCEAMSVGLPSVCFDSIPFKDLGIPNKDFSVASYDSKDNLENCIEIFINSEELRNKIRNSALSINTRLNNNIFCEKFEALIVR